MKTATPAPKPLLNGTGQRFAIAASRYNSEVTGKLVTGALDALTEHGVSLEDVLVVWVPGAFELPLAAQRLAQAGGVNAVVCVGCIIKGETNHDEVIAYAIAAGITQVALGTGIPVLLGVVSANNQEQALARAGGFANRGHEAALAALEMAIGGSH